MIQIRQLLLIGLSIFVLSACQTNMLKQFSRIQNGMDKHDVVEIMGNPTSTNRLHGKDRWQYIFYEDNVRHSKEIHFNDGSIVYMGDLWQPEADKRADAVDKKNAALNVSLDQEDKQKKEAARKAFADYEKKVRSDEKVQYMPEFVPVQ
ncbi:MAG: outer membrane protein assembly factor BamE [Bdellovibrionota bacterium]